MNIFDEVPAPQIDWPRLMAMAIVAGVAEPDPPPESLSIRFNREILLKEDGRIEARVVLVGKWPKRACIDAVIMDLGFWEGFPRFVRDGDRLLVEINAEQALYRIVGPLANSHSYELELIGCS